MRRLLGVLLSGLLALSLAFPALAQGPPEPITLRSEKGSDLTPDEADDDIENLVHLFTGADKASVDSPLFSLFVSGEAGLTGTDCDAAAEARQVRIDTSTWTLNVCDGSAWVEVKDHAATLAELNAQISSGLVTGPHSTAADITLAGDVSGAGNANTVDDVQSATTNLEAADNDTTQVSSTSFVQQEINGAGGTDLSCSTGQCNVDAAVARLAGPVFTGDPTAPTPSVDDSDTSLATTAFVQAETIAAADISGTIGGGLTIDTDAVAADEIDLTASYAWTGILDASGATRTAPRGVSTTPPASCTVGDEWFDTDATAGERELSCDPANTWTAHGDGGGGGTPGGSDTEVQYNDATAFGGISEFTYANATGLLSYAPTLDEATGNEIGLDLSATFNKASSGDATALRVNVVDTLSPGAASIFDGQVAGSSVFTVAALASAVEGFSFTPTTSGGDPIFSSAGASASLDLAINSKGTSALILNGHFQLNSVGQFRAQTTGNGPMLVDSAATATAPTVLPNWANLTAGLGGTAGVPSIIAANNVEVARFNTFASGTNYWDFYPAAISGHPELRVSGTGTNIDAVLVPKGTGAVDINLDCSTGDQYLTTGADGRIVCGTDNSGGGATITVKENNSVVDAAVTTLDFADPFDVLSSPAGEANITFDFTETGLDLTAVTDGQALYDSSDSLAGMPQLTHDGTNLTLTLAMGDDVQADEVMIEVRNNSGTTIFACGAVYISGFDGAQLLPEISVADADGSGTMPSIGVLEADLATATSGFAVFSGRLSDQDTSVGEGWSAGDDLYINTSGTSTTADCADTLTSTRPTGATALVQKVGEVVRVNATLGVVEIFGAGRSNDVPNAITIGTDDTINTDSVTLDNTWSTAQLAAAVVLDTENPAAADIEGDYATGLTIVADAVGGPELENTASLSGDHALAANEQKFGLSGLIFEGSAADAFESYVSVINPTADRTLTVPDADTAPGQAVTCSGTDKTSAFNATTGAFTCTADDVGTDTLDDLSDDLITALSGVTTVTDGSYCQGGAGSSMDCDVATIPAADIDAAIARLAGPIFTGDPTAPTPAVNDNDTSVATTAFVQAETAAAGDLSGTLGGGLTIDANAVAAAEIDLTAAYAWTGTLDASGATRTAPNVVGTAPPGTCTIGDTFFDTDETAGQRFLSCDPANTWTAHGDGGGTPAWEGLVNTADTATAYTSNNTSETVTFDFQSAFAADQFSIKQTTGNPTAGTLFDLRAADAQVIVLRAGDGTNGITVDQAGALTAEGTGTITATSIESPATVTGGTLTECVMLGTGALTCDDATGCIKAQADLTNYSTQVADFDDTTGEDGFWNFDLPANLSGTTATVAFRWTSAACTASSADDVCWTVDSGSFGNSEAWTTGTLGGTLVGEMDTCDAANEIYLSDTVSLTHSWTAGEHAVLAIARDPAAGPSGCASDNISGDARLIAVRVCYEVDNVFSGE